MYNTPYDAENYFDRTDAWEYEDYSSVVLESGITSIGAWAFEISPADSIVIPEGVTSIEAGVFAYSKLSSVTIPVSVSKIETCAFIECENLTDVYYNGTQTQWDSIAIDTDNEALISAAIHLAEAEKTSFDPPASAAEAPASSGSGEITVTVNGSAVSFDRPPVISEGRTLVPVRAIAEAFDCQADRDSTSKTVVITDN
ncbi:MAG: leucine-rich repeat protein [Clostridiales bacterium]|nr:leucine-rich repeat protein [Clostridiales bacterium]